MMNRLFCVSLALFAIAPGPFCCATAQDSPPVKTKDAAHTNRLAKESSPYLLQHAHNPVDWYPWGDEAIEKAKRENKMIFLSVGYAACHWCHVMERESFVDPEIAALMNEKFVCVKVDREERPDVDQIYMTAVQMISGGGGWPMSVFLLPDTKPFWGGTYFPARTGDRGNATGFLPILKQVDQAWTEKRAAVQQQAATLTAAIRASQISGDAVADATDDVELSSSLVKKVADALTDQFDPQFGGFGYSPVEPNRPKFPEPSNLVFLLNRMSQPAVEPGARDNAKRMLLKSLDGMISGSMLDHFGGGFHRYSVDRRWQIPHFEKMLYDNGQLASVYSQAFEETNREEYRRVVEGICDFVLRELRAPGGAFYSALDADSEGEEGKFYRWTKEEIAEAASTVPNFTAAAEVYRFNAAPNFEGEFYAPDPRNTLTEIASQQGKPYAQLDDELKPTRKQLLAIRDRRQRPLTDIKILTAWNGLMIAGLADASRILDREDYTQAAAKAAEFVLESLRDEGGRLYRSYAADEAKLNAYLDDYAFLISGLIALHRATNDAKWLSLAREVMSKQIELFSDERNGGFYFTSSDHAALILRTKDPLDGALPSGIGVTAENLHYLAGVTNEENYTETLRKTLQSLVPMFERAPAGVPRAAAVMADYLEAQTP